MIVSLPFPDELPEDMDLGAVTAKTLLLYGTADTRTGNSHGTRWQKKLPNARLEMVPNGGHDLLVPKWGRISCPTWLHGGRRAETTPHQQLETGF